MYAEPGDDLTSARREPVKAQLRGRGRFTALLRPDYQVHAENQGAQNRGQANRSQGNARHGNSLSIRLLTRAAAHKDAPRGSIAATWLILCPFLHRRETGLLARLFR